jgi:hypothetical protein
MCSAISIVVGSLSRKFAIQVKRIISLEFSFHEVANQGFFCSSSNIFLQTQVLKNGVGVKLQRNALSVLEARSV